MPHAERRLPAAVEESLIKARSRDNQVLISRIGLRFPTNLTYDNWERAGMQLSRILDSSAWCLGDWLVCGQENYADRYVRAIETAGLDYQTLRNYAWVVRRFPLSRRRKTLSFQHHAEVASLPAPEQDAWLDNAEKSGWSRNELRRQLRRSRQAEQPAVARPSLLPRLPVASDRVERWRAAAQRSNDHLENWMVSILDRAAEDALSVESQQPDQLGR